MSAISETSNVQNYQLFSQSFQQNRPTDEFSKSSNGRSKKIESKESFEFKAGLPEESVHRKNLKSDTQIKLVEHNQRLVWDLIPIIFKECLYNGDVRECLALAYLNKNSYEVAKSWIGSVDLKQLPWVSIIGVEELIEEGLRTAEYMIIEYLIIMQSDCPDLTIDDLINLLITNYNSPIPNELNKLLAQDGVTDREKFEACVKTLIAQDTRSSCEKFRALFVVHDTLANIRFARGLDDSMLSPALYDLCICLNQIYNSYTDTCTPPSSVIAPNLNNLGTLKCFSEFLSGKDEDEHITVLAIPQDCSLEDLRRLFQEFNISLDNIKKSSREQKVAHTCWVVFNTGKFNRGDMSIVNGPFNFKYSIFHERPARVLKNPSHQGYPFDSIPTLDTYFFQEENYYRKVLLLKDIDSFKETHNNVSDYLNSSTICELRDIAIQTNICAFLGFRRFM